MGTVRSILFIMCDQHRQSPWSPSELLPQVLVPLRSQAIGAATP
jgi:hypothetical protein